MKTILKLTGLLAMAPIALSSAPFIDLQPQSLFADIGQTFKVDVTLSYNSTAELGEPAELSAFGFNFSYSDNLLFGQVQFNPAYDDLSLFSNEVVGLAGLTGGSTASSLIIASLFFTTIDYGAASISIAGDRFDPSGVLGLYYTTLGDINDPLDDHTFTFDIAGDAQITVVHAVPEPAMMGTMGGALIVALVTIRRYIRRREGRRKSER